MEIVILGSGTSIPRPGRAPSGMLVSEGELSWLVDAGPGSLHRMATAGVLLEDLHGLLISHLHLDHVSDLIAALFALKNPQLKRRKPLEIYGPPGLAAFLGALVPAWGTWTLPGAEAATILEFDGAPRESMGWELRAAPVLHGASGHGLRLRSPQGASVCYSGDTDECEALVELARAADLLVLECSHDDAAKLPGHLSPTPCGRIAKQAGVGQLLLTHFYPGWDPDSALSVVEGHYRGPVRLAVDGLRLRLDGLRTA